MFDPDNAIYRILYWVECQLILNIIFITSCIPLITIGTSICSLYEIQFQLIRNEETILIKSYWNAFKSNIKTTLIPWMCFILFCIVSYMWYIGFKSEYWQFPVVVEILVYTVCFAVFFVSSYFCPVKAFYKLSAIETLKKSVRIAIYAFPLSIIKFGTIFIPIYVGVHLQLRTIILLGSVWLLFGISMINRINARLFYNRIMNIVSEKLF